MKIINARNPAFTENGNIDLEVLFEEIGQYIPFTASPNDVEAHGVTLYNNALANMYGTVAPYVAPVIPLEDAKETKIAEVKSAFEQASVDAHVMSSLGFEINAGSVAKRDIDGLIEKMEYSGQETELFRGYDNEFHQVTLDQLKLMRIEVIDNGNALYQRKWQLEAQINACTTTEQVNAINIDFEV